MTSPSTPTGWQDIASAPKDGTWVSVYWPGMPITFYPLTAFWDEGWEPALTRDFGEVFPTHWMPLPAPPSGDVA